MTERVRHVPARDGTPIAYVVRGAQADGDAPALVFTSGFTASHFYWRHLLPRFEPHARLIAWDLKGHGSSGPARDPLAVRVEDSVDDLRRVLDACGVERAVLFAFSLGCQVILEAWRHMPARIAGLVPILGTYERPFDNLFHPALGPRLFRVFRRVGPTIGGPALKAGWLQSRAPLSFRLSQRLGLIGPRVAREDMEHFFAHMPRIHGPTWARMGIAAQEHSARDLLPTITAPVLVVGGGKDTFTPTHLSEHMARAIPGAELLLLPEGTHTGLFEFPSVIADRAEAFLRAHELLAAPPPQAARSHRLASASGTD
ncbi:MAG: alpha/beta fold hydrolase [Planctomycetota bacterium]